VSEVSAENNLVIALDMIKKEIGSKLYQQLFENLNLLKFRHSWIYAVIVGTEKNLGKQ
jgi:hypothetical protein